LAQVQVVQPKSSKQKTIGNTLISFPEDFGFKASYHIPKVKEVFDKTNYNSIEIIEVYLTESCHNKSLANDSSIIENDYIKVYSNSKLNKMVIDTTALRFFCSKMVEMDTAYSRKGADYFKAKLLNIYSLSSKLLFVDNDDRVHKTLYYEVFMNEVSSIMILNLWLVKGKLIYIAYFPQVTNEERFESIVDRNKQLMQIFKGVKQ
jgi:hypothetical protein